MNTRRLTPLNPQAAVAIGAGLAAALLFSLTAKMTLLALALAWLAPLPLMIALLAFGPSIGAGSVGTAALTIFFLQLVSTDFGGALRSSLTFALAVGLPSFWLSYLFLQSRTKGSLAWSVAPPATSPYLREYCPLERILTTAIAISATLGVLAVLFLMARHGSLQGVVDQLADPLVPFLEEALGSGRELPAGYDYRAVAQLIVLSSPPFAAGSHLLAMMLNLWLAARVTQVSGRLTRPWPDVAHELRLPRIYGVFFAIAILAAFAGGLAGLIAAILAATIGTAFALQGLAVVHDFARGSRGRVPLLVLIYGGLPIFMPWSLIPFILIGLVEAAFSLRDRKTAPPPETKD
jgi:hypothetical protein